MTTVTVSPSERLEIERACERLVHRYMRALDLSDMDAAADCFDADGSLSRPMTPDQVVQGREAIRASLKTRPRGLVTRHLATNVVIDVTTASSATGLCYLTMIGCTPPEVAAPPFEAPGPLFFGEFRDRFVKVAGEWKFLERRGSIAIRFSRSTG